MKDIVVFGTGGFGREVHQLIEDINQAKAEWTFLGWLDGNTERHGSNVHGHPVLGGVDWLLRNPETSVVVAVGTPNTRCKIVASMSELGHSRFGTLIHPRAWVGNRVEVGKGSIICAGSLITTDITIGNHVILNIGCTIGHDSVFGDYVTVSPAVNVSGNVRIAEGCDIGTNSTLIQGITIGHWTVLGAGAVVVRDLPPNVTAVGMPAKVIKERNEGWHRE